MATTFTPKSSIQYLLEFVLPDGTFEAITIGSSGTDISDPTIADVVRKTFGHVLTAGLSALTTTFPSSSLFPSSSIYPGAY